jgi:flagellin
MSSGVTLSAGVRANLLSLQDTANMMQTTQNRLATGKKVNSALDNPLNFFTSSSLSSRASDLSGLLDSMSNGLQTIQTANNGMTAITSLVQQLQATVSQARSDARVAPVTAGAAKTSALSNTSAGANNQLTFKLAGGNSVSINTVATGAPGAVITGVAGGAATATGNITITSGNINGGQAVNVALTSGDSLTTVATKINAAIVAADPTNGGHLWADASSGELSLTNDGGYQITMADGTGGTGDTAAILGTGGATSTATTSPALSVDSLIAAINGNASLNTQVKASKDATTGGLSLQNLTTAAITVDGAKSTGVTGVAADTETLAAGSGGGISTVRQSLMNQFNSLRVQIDKVASDSGYNGINLLNGDDLKLSFNENGTSSIDVQTKDSTGASFAINSANLGITNATASQFGDNTQLDTLSGNLSTSLTTLRTQASALGSSLSVVQTRQDFTKAMINSLQTGADNLVLADSNQEGANLLALQTRQSLSTTALSLSAQADKNVLQLFQ